MKTRVEVKEEKRSLFKEKNIGKHTPPNTILYVTHQSCFYHNLFRLLSIRASSRGSAKKVHN